MVSSKDPVRAPQLFGKLSLCLACDDSFTEIFLCVTSPFLIQNVFTLHAEAKPFLRYDVQKLWSDLLLCAGGHWR